MRPFLGDDFLLQSKTAVRLYHEYAKSTPIIDYHNHLPPEEISTNKKFNTITEAWLKGDHYKWRAMRANGINEDLITGKSTDKEKFLNWAKTVPYTMRNPLYHWTHLELQRYFNINDLLSEKSAEEIYEKSNHLLATDPYSTQGLLNQMNVEVVCTTDEPTDSLEHHIQFKASGKKLKMLPAFRPDKLILIDNSHFAASLEKLEELEGNPIITFDHFIAALENRIDYFHKHDCRLADHGLSHLYTSDYSATQLDATLSKKKAKKVLSPEERDSFHSAVLHHLAEMYHDRGWTMQFHLGALRNNSDRLSNLLGADVGADSIGDWEQAENLSRFFNKLDQKQKLTKTIIYNLNPRDNEVFATMIGNYNDGSMPGKIQWGSGWWFLDQKDGMEKQLNTLSNMGLLSRFLGMLTDSRSFLSFPRHEYFRRILCNLLGQDVENGELPNDIEWLGKLVKDISYFNAKNYFNF